MKSFGKAASRNGLEKIDKIPGGALISALPQKAAAPPEEKTEFKPVNPEGTLGRIILEADGKVSRESIYNNLKKLQSYVEKLEDRGSGDAAAFAQNSPRQEFKAKIEQYAERISKDIYETLDARFFALNDEKKMREEISECIVAVSQHRAYNLSPTELAAVYNTIASDIFGLGPLEELLTDDRISDIMVNGSDEVFAEINGQIEKINIRFRSATHLLNICRRIVGRVGRRVDESSPICDARLSDGSRVNIILPPLALNGAVLTIRRFRKDTITLRKMLEFDTINEQMAALLQIISACRVNVLVSGGTGSGKTTLLNCLTKYISPRERIVTCEDAAELQLQQPHVVSLEMRPAGIEGAAAVTMRDLVRNCLRMRPDRIVVGEVRGPEAFDLLQAMNTGHDGSMGTLHANNPRDAVSRLENMISMNTMHIPTRTIREQIASSLNIIVHVQRLRDGSRKIMNISEITGMEGDVVTMQDLITYEITGEDENGNVTGQFRSSGLRPAFYHKARQFNLEKDLLAIMAAGTKHE